MEGADGSRRRVAYADPPYPGTSRKYYRNEPTYAGEVDHVALLSSLQEFDGWALSTSAKALRDLLPLCPREARVCAWGKPHGVSSKTRGLHNAWEPVIVVPARRVRPGVADWLSARPARGGGETLMGRKPVKFCAWLFRVLGMMPGDELVDVFPGTGVVSAAWAEVSRRSSGDAAGSARTFGSALAIAGSATAVGSANPDASLEYSRDTSPAAVRDESSGAGNDTEPSLRAARAVAFTSDQAFRRGSLGAVADAGTDVDRQLRGEQLRWRFGA
jgi:hypothetical protein